MANEVKMRKGGTTRLIVERFKDEDTVTIPAGFRIEYITVKKIGTTAGNILVGTAQGGGQVVNTAALSVTNGNIADLTLILKTFAADTKLYIDVSTLATGDISFQIQKMF